VTLEEVMKKADELANIDLEKYLEERGLLALHLLTVRMYVVTAQLIAKRMEVERELRNQYI